MFLKHCLEVDGLGVSGHGSLLEGLGKCGVSVAGSGNVLTGSTIFESQSTLSDHLTSVGADDVNAENAVSLGISEHLDHTLSVLVGLGSGVGNEGEGSDSVRDVLVLQVLLALADPGDLRVGVHNGGNGTIVDMTIPLLDVLDNGNSLLLSLMGKHRAEGDITDTSDVGDLGSVLGVNDDTAAVISLKANVLKAEAAGVRSSTNGNEDYVGLDRFGLATLGRVNLKLDLIARLVTTDNLGVELELETLLLEDLLCVLGNLSVHTGATNLAEELDNSDLGAKSRPDGGHLKTNDTTTNDGHGLRDLLKSDGTSAGDNALLVDLKTGERSGLGTSSNKDVLAANAGLTALVEVDLDLMLVDERTGTLDVLDAVLLEEVLDTLGKTANGSLLGLHEVGQVKLDLADLDTAGLGVVKNLVVEMRVVEERF